MIRLGLVSLKIIDGPKGRVIYSLTRLGEQALKDAAVSKKPERKVVPYRRKSASGQSTRKAA